jgi:hypothetical protein
MIRLNKSGCDGAVQHLCEQASPCLHVQVAFGQGWEELLAFGKFFAVRNAGTISKYQQVRQCI